MCLRPIAGSRRAPALQVFPARLPADVNNLKLVEGLPRALAAFLAALAALALVHTLVTTVRRRRHDLAVLRTLGFVGSQVSATVAWQATTFVVVGLVVGIPLGVAAGRTAWSLVADRHRCRRPTGDAPVAARDRGAVGATDGQPVGRSTGPHGPADPARLGPAHGMSVRNEVVAVRS